MANDAFTAGLVHEIGKVVLTINLPEKFELSKSLAEQENISSMMAEKRIFESTHSEVGAYLLGLWGLPQSIVEAVAFHQLPGELQTNSFSPLTAVHIANIFHSYPKAEVLGKPESLFDVKYLEDLNLMKKIPVWYEKFIESEK